MLPYFGISLLCLVQLQYEKGPESTSTWKPAQVINRPLLGNLSVGAEGDIAIFNIRKGNFGFYDKTGFKLKGTEKLECEVTIKGGKVLFDLNGLANPIYVK